jgi:hypothetical protein
MLTLPGVLGVANTFDLLRLFTGGVPRKSGIGYPHPDRTLGRHLVALQEKKPGNVPEASCLDHFSAKKAMWLFIRRSTDLDEKEQEELVAIRQASETAEIIY